MANGEDAEIGRPSGRLRPDREYELFVRAVTVALSQAKHHDEVEVIHDAKVEGSSGHRHQVDVLWKYKIRGKPRQVVVECRHFRAKLTVKHVLELLGRLKDLPGHRGILVTREGFQKGALALAKKHGVQLKVIRPPRDADYDGRMRVIELHLRTSSVEPLGLNLILDEDWIAKLPDDVRGLIRATSETARPDAAVIVDRGGGQRWTLEDLFRGLPVTDGEACQLRRFEDAFVEYKDGRPTVRVLAAVLRFRNIETLDVARIGGEPDDAVVADPLTGTSLFMDAQARFTGDTEREGVDRAVSRRHPPTDD